MAAPATALAVPASVLDTDLYKLSMQQAVLKTFPDVQASYRFANRNSHTLFSRQCAERFRTAVSHFTFLSLTPEEREWLAKTCPFLEPAYLDYLASYRYKPEQVDIVFKPADPSDSAWGQITITVSGPWVETIMWEVPLMASLSETFFQTVDKDWDYEGQQELAFEKGQTLLGAGCAFSDFGTRRRRSFRAHEIVVEALVKASREASGQPGRLVGTSNVHLARLYGLAPIGTIAHEWFMGIAALRGYENANGKALQLWEDVYGAYPTTLIALTDTFTTNAFFQDFSADNTRAQRWTGLRQDSGDPFQFGPRVKEIYESMGIDPATKLLVFSDSLSTEKAAKLQGQCDLLGLKKVSYGIGTHFTNDFRSISSGRMEKSKALNIVIKLSQVDGNPCIKLSDDLTKTTGDASTVDHVANLYHLYNKS